MIAGNVSTTRQAVAQINCIYQFISYMGSMFSLGYLMRVDVGYVWTQRITGRSCAPDVAERPA